MTVAEFLVWSADQPQGRYELVHGEVIAMAPERAQHNLAKFAIARALDEAVRRAGLPCTVFTDGMTLVIDETTAREPDAAVQCNQATEPAATVLRAPLIVVEVSSPSSERSDTGDKLVEYFSVPSIRHYLIINVQKRVVVHHARKPAGDIATRILSDGDLVVEPPGIAIPVAPLFGTAG